MPNIRNASTSNIVFPLCNICEKSVSDKDDTIQCLYMSGLNIFKM